MGTFDAEDCRRRYRALMARQPELFGGGGTDGHRIVTAPRDARRCADEASAARRRQGLSVEDLRVGVLADDPYLCLIRDAVRFPDGRRGLYNRVLVPPGVVVLPVMGERIVLIRQFRHATRRHHLELPRGIATLHSGAEADARRELAEEIAAEPSRMADLGRIHTSSGMTAEEMYLFIAWIDGHGAPERGEGISAIMAPTRPEFEAMIAAGEVSDGPTLAAYAKAKILGHL